MMHWESDRASLLVSDYLRGDATHSRAVGAESPRQGRPESRRRGCCAHGSGPTWHRRRTTVTHREVADLERGERLAGGRVWADGADGEGSHLDARRGGAGEGRPDNRGE